MFQSINPKLPMLNKAITKVYYIDQLGFENAGSSNYDEYLMVKKDQIEIHFFEFKGLDPKENYGQIYIRTDDIEGVYQHFIEKNIIIHPNGHLETKPWGQKEFSLLDPNNNLITFGQSLD